LKNVELGECRQFYAYGDAHNGIALGGYGGNTFYYDTLNYQSLPFHSSKLIATTQNWGNTYVSTDNTINALSPCGSIAEHQPKQQLKWYQSGGNLIITVPNDCRAKAI